MKKYTLAVVMAFVTSLYSFSAAAATQEEQEMQKFKDVYAKYNQKVEAGDVKGSLPLAKESYELGSMLFEPDSANLLALMDNYAYTLIAVGKAKEAQKVYLDLLEENEEFYGRYSAGLIPILEGLSKIVVKDKAKSKEYAVRALKLKMRHNSMEMTTKIPEGKLERPKHASKLKSSAKGVVKADFNEMETDHFIVIYQKGHEEGAELLTEQLEIAYKSIRSFLLALNFSQRPISEKLLAVMFGSKEEYLQYLESQRYSTRSAGSYYHDSEAILIYDEVHKRSKWEYFKRTNTVSAELMQYIAVEAKMMNKNKDYYPRWFYDGLASTFEFNDIEQEFGPHTQNLSARNWEFAQELIDDGRWKTINDFIRMTRAEEQVRENKHLVYYMGTFLVRFLYTNYSDEMIKYLELVPANMKPKDQSGNQRAKIFRKAFGDPKEMEKDWRRFLQSFGITFPD